MVVGLAQLVSLELLVMSNSKKTTEKMSLFIIKSLSGRSIPVSAESLSHAIQKAIREEDFKYTETDYGKLNKKMIKKSNR
jgi:hypothetical protein